MACIRTGLLWWRRGIRRLGRFRTLAARAGRARSALGGARASAKPRLAFCTLDRLALRDCGDRRRLPLHVDVHANVFRLRGVRERRDLRELLCLPGASVRHAGASLLDHQAPRMERCSGSGPDAARDRVALSEDVSSLSRKRADRSPPVGPGRGSWRASGCEPDGGAGQRSTLRVSSRRSRPAPAAGRSGVRCSAVRRRDHGLWRLPHPGDQRACS